MASTKSKKSSGGTNGAKRPRKGDRVRIVNVDLNKESMPRRYLDRRGTVLGVRKGVAEVEYKDRVEPMRISVDKLERCR